MSSEQRRPVIALAMGDPAGISPELTAELDIAGRGVASIGARKAAVRLASEMAAKRARTQAAVRAATAS